jgi:D-aminopeptidase
MKPRWRELAQGPGVFPTGPLNSITDVGGVLVGHRTVIQGEKIRTGVTAILPHNGNLFQQKVGGAVFVANAFGKLAGSTQVEELGTIETPILLTNTLAVGLGLDALVRYTLAQAGNEKVRSVNGLVGETNDGMLNDIRALPLRTEDFLAAIAAAKAGPVEEGSVGAGTGTVCFGWKGGIGSSSRRLPNGFLLGVLVQTNYGGQLTMGGIPVGKTLRPRRDDGGDGSCMIVVATDAPMTARDLKR